jgi:uncharacterized membrane protein YuzA (DUF378 family)
MNIVQKTCLFFTIVGAINWGLIGLFGFNLVATLFGDMTIASRVIYTLVGISALINVMLFFVDLDDLTVLETPRARAK